MSAYEIAGVTQFRPGRILPASFGELAAMDLFVVPTISFRLLYRQAGPILRQPVLGRLHHRYVGN